MAPKKQKDNTSRKFLTQIVPLGDVKPHPRNYRVHPPDQLEHIAQSIREHGFYRNVVVAREGTILAGHGVVEAAKAMGLTEIPVVMVDLDPNEPRALKLLAGDNEMLKLAEVDDRVLTEMLKELSESEGGLLGTGFDEKMLAALLMVTRPASEIRDGNEAAEWVGMPAYDEGGPQIKVVITFKNEEDRKRYVKEHDLKIDKIAGLTWSTRWPFTIREDASAIRFEATKA